MTQLSSIVLRDITANRPAAGTPGRLFFDTTLVKMQRDNGSTWDDVEGAGGLSNPMTTQDDIIIGGSSGTPTRLAKGTDSQVLTVDPSTHHLVWATPSGASGAMTQLATITVGIGGSTTIDFTSISGSYNHLRLEYMLRGTGAGTSVDFWDLKVNNDAGSSYFWTWDQLVGTAATESGGGQGTSAGTAARIGLMPQGGNSSGFVAKGVIEIPFYADTNFHKAITNYEALIDSSGARPMRSMVHWISTAAITRLTFTAEANSFAQNSQAILYGIT